MTESIWRITKDEPIGQRGMVVARNPIAAREGLNVLRRGGNAVDAAVTMAFALGVLDPMSSGIGGGGMMVVHDAASGRTTSIDYAMDAPLAARPGSFELEEGPGSSAYGWRKVKNEANVVGCRAASVPGAVAGLAAALERFGTISLGEALQPAIRHAEEGIEVDAILAFGVAMNMANLSRFPATASVFLPKGFPPRDRASGSGDRLVQRDLGRTLHRIADQGPDGFYRGEIGQRITDYFQENGGLISKEDLARYRPTFTEGGQTTTYRGHEIVGVPGACGGVTGQQALNIYEGFDLAASGAGNLESLHIEAEAFRRAFADRYAFIGDPNQSATPWAGLLSKEYASSRGAEIDPTRATADVAPGDPGRFEASARREPAVRHGAAPLGGSTTHLSVMDRERNTVSLTETIVNGFGCGAMAPETGVLMNNAMSWFDPEPGRVNSMAPGKRGLNNMSPFVVLRDGKPLIAVGAAGGRKIIQAVAQIISNVIDHGMGIQDAIAAPRIDCSGASVQASARFSGSVIEALWRLGHRVEIAEETFVRYPFATALGALVDADTGRLHGGVDPYRPALAAGY